MTVEDARRGAFRPRHGWGDEGVAAAETSNGTGVEGLLRGKDRRRTRWAQAGGRGRVEGMGTGDLAFCVGVSRATGAGAGG